MITNWPSISQIYYERPSLELMKLLSNNVFSKKQFLGLVLKFEACLPTMQNDSAKCYSNGSFMTGSFVLVNYRLTYNLYFLVCFENKFNLFKPIVIYESYIF